MSVLGLTRLDGLRTNTLNDDRGPALDRVSVLSEGMLEELRTRFNSSKLPPNDEQPAYALLGQVLALVYPLKVADLLSKQLLSAFGSIGASLTARVEQIHSMIPQGEEVYVILQAMHRLLIGALREKIQDGQYLRNSADLHNYLRLTLSYETSEQVRLLHLDSTNQLIKDEMHAVGTSNAIAIYPREIVRRALHQNSSALIIVHNHPSGDPTPSLDDIEMTRQIMRALHAINIHVHDHVIVGRRGCYSFKAEGLLAECNR